MKREEELEERQRALHAMLRRTGERGDPAPMDPDEMAALLAGALFDSEIRLLENRIVADEALEAEARALHAEFESGAVPRLVRRQRRTTERAPARTGGIRFLRRQGPYLLALVVFVVVGVLPYSVRSCGGRAEHEVKPGSYALSSRGSPRLILPEGEERVIFAGAVLPPSARVRLAPGDELRLLTAGGARRVVDREGEKAFGTANRQLGELFTLALRNREARSLPEIEEDGVRDVEAVEIISPRGRLLRGDPEFRWESRGGPTRVRLSVLDASGQERFARALATDRWRYPATEAPLPGGQRYRLVLRDFGRGDEIAAVDFEVAPARDVAARSRLREALGELGEESPHLLEVEWLVAEGHLGEAFLVAERLLDRAGDSIELRTRLATLAWRLGLRRLAVDYARSVRERISRDD